MIVSDVEQSQIQQLVAKNNPMKVIQSVISTVKTREQKMIKFGKKNKNQQPR